MSSSAWPSLPDRLQLSTDSVHIVHIELQADDAEIDRFRSMLSSDEVSRADRYKIERARRQFIVCRASLRQILSGCVDRAPDDLDFDVGPHGKPHLRLPDKVAGSDALNTRPAVEFSVSHSGEHALIAVGCERRLGIDLERLDESVRILKLAERFFSANETRELNRLPVEDQLAGFFRGWTCKEAYLKATGFGLAFPLNKFTVSMNPDEPARLLDVVDDAQELQRWTLHSLDGPVGFAAALIVEASPDENVVFHCWKNTPHLNDSD